MKIGALKAEAKAAIRKFGISQETLTLEEFIVMLGHRPWLKMMPEAVRDHVLMTSAQTRTGKASTANASAKPPGKRAFIAARRLFDDADVNCNGDLDEEELSLLMLKLYKRIGTPITGELRQSIVEKVRTSMKKFDNGTGVLTFVQW